MARGINKVILIGHLGNAPEVRQTTAGGTVTNISLATSETWKDKQTGQSTERTEWHRVIFFNRLAEIVGQYCQKGSKIYLEGRLQTRKWTDKDGQERYTTEIIAHEMQLLDSRPQPAQQAHPGLQSTAQSSPSGPLHQPFPDEIVQNSQPSYEDLEIPF